MHNRIGFHILRNIRDYKVIIQLHIDFKLDLHFLVFSYSVWKHVACNKLEIEESLAWM